MLKKSAIKLNFLYHHLLYSPDSSEYLTTRNFRFVNSAFIKENIFNNEKGNYRIYRDLKRIKILRNLNLKSFQKQSMKKITLVALNNRKSLQRIESYSKGIPKFLFEKLPNLREDNIDVNAEQSWKILFFHKKLKSLIIDSSSEVAPNFSITQLRLYVYRLLKLYPRLHPLECLTITGSYNQALMTILAEIEIIMQYNRSLKHINFQKMIELTAEEGDKQSFIKIFSLVENISCTLIETSTFFNEIIRNADYLNRLENLNVYFEVAQIESWCLLKNVALFKSLKTFSLSSPSGKYTPPYMLSFLENFSLPKSIEVVELYLGFIDWKLVFSKAFKWDDGPNNLSYFLKFCKAWQNLKNLKHVMLYLDIQSLDSKVEFAKGFLQNLFRSIVSLRTLCLNFDSATLYETYQSEDALPDEALKLSDIFSSMTHLAQDLKELKVTFPLMEIKGLYQLINAKFKLDCLSLYGNFFDASEMDHLRYFLANNGKISLKELIINGDEIHSDILRNIMLFRQNVCGSIGIIAKDEEEGIQVLSDILDFMSECDKPRNIKISYRIKGEELLDLLEKIGYSLKKNTIFEEVEIRTSDKLFKFYRDKKRVIIRDSIQDALFEDLLSNGDFYSDDGDNELDFEGENYFDDLAKKREESVENTAPRNQNNTGEVSLKKLKND